MNRPSHSEASERRSSWFHPPRREASTHAAAIAIKAVDAKDKDGLLHALDGIDKACESCHLHYWYPNDKRAREAAKEDGITE